MEGERPETTDRAETPDASSRTRPALLLGGAARQESSNAKVK